jgi:hypothetical protein
MPAARRTKRSELPWVRVDAILDRAPKGREEGDGV